MDAEVLSHKRNSYALGLVTRHLLHSLDLRTARQLAHDLLGSRCYRVSSKTKIEWHRSTRERDAPARASGTDVTDYAGIQEV